MRLAQERPYEVFRLYIGLGHERSLKRLVTVCKEAGYSASLATLKRWSARYNWRAAVEEHVKTISRDLAQAAELERVEAVKSRIDGIRRLQDRFTERALIDSDDPSLPLRQRRRAIKVTFAGFIRLIRFERELLQQTFGSSAKKAGARR